LREETYGWPLEMQMKAARAGLRILEVPVDYRRRAGGQSKIAGTVFGSIKAAARILFTLARIAVQREQTLQEHNRQPTADETPESSRRYQDSRSRRC